MTGSQAKLLVQITKKVKGILKDSFFEAYIFLFFSKKDNLNFSCIPVDAFYLFSVTNILNQIEIKKPDKKMKHSSHVIAQPKTFPYSTELMKAGNPKEYLTRKSNHIFIYIFLNEKYTPFQFYSISAKKSPIPLTFFTDIIKQSKLDSSPPTTIAIPLTLLSLTSDQPKNDEIEIE